MASSHYGRSGWIFALATLGRPELTSSIFSGLYIMVLSLRRRAVVWNYLVAFIPYPDVFVAFFNHVVAFSYDIS